MSVMSRPPYQDWAHETRALEQRWPCPRPWFDGGGLCNRRREILRRHRPAKKIALAMITANILQQAALLVGLDAFNRDRMFRTWPREIMVFRMA